MRVVITGAAGFIGSNLTRHWLGQNPEDHVLAFDLLTYAGRLESLDDLRSNPRFTFLRGDVADPKAVAEAIKDAELVVHLAAESHNDRAVANPTPFLHSNVLGTGILLEECRKFDVPRFHHVSTDEVFGSLPLGTSEKFTENSPYRPRGPYSASKAASDHLVRAWHETYGLRTTISNCGNNFGPFQFPEKLVALAISRLIDGEKVPLYGKGTNVRDWIFVGDHVDALDLIAHRGASGSTYLISAGRALSNRTVVDSLLSIFQRGPETIDWVEDRPGHDLRYELDASRIRSELGWTPKYDWEAALKETVEWYRTHESWWRPLLPSVRSVEARRTSIRA